MKLAAAVILYHPTQEAIVNIESYYDEFDRVFVFDNTEGESFFEERLSKYKKISYHHDHQNRGIAERLNSAAKLATAEGFTWLFTLDQDSNFSLDTLHDYLLAFEAFDDKSEVAMFGIEHEQVKLKVKSLNAYTEVDHLITSGCLVNLPLFNQVGGFDEKLFIDLVDVELSIRIKKAGLRIIKFDGIIFSHCIGKLVNRASIKSMFLVKKQKEVHSALRCYYMYRNSFYVQDKHKDYDPYLMGQYRHSAVDRVWSCLYYGRNAWGIFKYMLRAKSDFINGRMGKLGDETPIPGIDNIIPGPLFHSSTNASQYNP